MQLAVRFMWIRWDFQKRKNAELKEIGLQEARLTPPFHILLVPLLDGAMLI